MNGKPILYPLHQRPGTKTTLAHAAIAGLLGCVVCLTACAGNQGAPGKKSVPTSSSGNSSEAGGSLPDAGKSALVADGGGGTAVAESGAIRGPACASRACKAVAIAAGDYSRALFSLKAASLAGAYSRTLWTG
jgi:hypothetical protein